MRNRARRGDCYASIFVEPTPHSIDFSFQILHAHLQSFDNSYFIRKYIHYISKNFISHFIRLSHS